MRPFVVIWLLVIVVRAVIYLLYTMASVCSMLCSVSRTRDEFRTRFPWPSSRTMKIWVSCFRAVDTQIRGSPMPPTTTRGRPGPARCPRPPDRCALAAPSTTRSPLMTRFTATTARRGPAPWRGGSTSRTVPEKMASACISRTCSGLSTHARRDASRSRNARIELDLRGRTSRTSDSAVDRWTKETTRTETSSGHDSDGDKRLAVLFPVVFLRPNAMPRACEFLPIS